MAVVDWFTVGGPGTSNNGATTIMIMTSTGIAELVMCVCVYVWSPVNSLSAMEGHGRPLKN